MINVKGMSLQQILGKSDLNADRPGRWLAIDTRRMPSIETVQAFRAAKRPRTTSQRMAEAGFKRRPGLASLPQDE